MLFLHLLLTFALISVIFFIHFIGWLFSHTSILNSPATSALLSYVRLLMLPYR